MTERKQVQIRQAATHKSAAFVLVRGWDYRVRQLRLVLARMPMKLGVKTARAKTVAMMAVYMV